MNTKNRAILRIMASALSATILCSNKVTLKYVSSGSTSSQPDTTLDGNQSPGEIGDCNSLCELREICLTVLNALEQNGKAKPGYKGICNTDPGCSNIPNGWQFYSSWAPAKNSSYWTQYGCTYNKQP